MLLELKRIIITKRKKIIFENTSWQEFETILDELGEHRNSRVAYNNGRLAIMTPLPEHEISKEVISDLLKALLEELDVEFWPLGSTTFKKESLAKGIEPDNCFYIENEAAVRGKNRLDLTTDPPPDLAIEIDLTSSSNLEIYAALKVPELWRFTLGKLEINVLQDDNKYVVSKYSPNFPNLSLTEKIPEYLERCKKEGRNKTMKAFRAWVTKNYDKVGQSWTKCPTYFGII